MISTNNFRILSDEEKSRYVLEGCEGCKLYDECELLSSYVTQLVKKTKVAPPMLVAKALPLHTAMATVIPAQSTTVKEKQNSIGQNKSTAILPQYIRDAFCPMRRFNLVECRNKWVADGIGDDFKVDIKYNYKTERYEVDKSSCKRNYFTGKWEPRQPVFISSQTGNGKNHFTENELFEYVRELNYKNQTRQKVLYISNRIALRLQIEDRLENGVAEDDEVYYSYKEFVDVMSYQSLLNKAELLKRVQQGKSKYLFVVCDEAHFFTSDASFNPDTEKILETIVSIFSNAIRLYMTATPYDCLNYIQQKESCNDNYIPAVIYHFKRDYRYLNAKYFSDENNELKDIIVNSVVNGNEKWLIFIDNKKHSAAFRRLLEYDTLGDSPLKGKVMTIDADSKNNDKTYQKMIVSEKFDKSINVVISTSVIDNGVNFRDVQNIVITDMNQTKCLQMVGRVRVDRNPVTKVALSRVTLYLKRHNEGYISRRLKAIGLQQDAYHAHDMASQSTNYELQFLNKYYDDELEDWDNAKHWFGREKEHPNCLYRNEIAFTLAEKYQRIYESILKEMSVTDKGVVTGQKYLEYQLSWFGKKYSKRNDITLNGYKNDGQLGFEKWIQEEWLDKKIPKEVQKDFGKMFFAKYNPVFGLCTKKQGFSTDDNRTANGPKTAGYRIHRIKEIFQIRKMPFGISEDNGCWVISVK